MTSYKIKEINQKEKWIAIEVDFGDGTPKYQKRMMADTTSEAGIQASVEQWLADYLPLREAELSVPDLSSLRNKSFSVDKDKLPKSSVQKAQDEEIRKAKQLADEKLAKEAKEAVDALAEAVK